MYGTTSKYANIGWQAQVCEVQPLIYFVNIRRAPSPLGFLLVVIMDHWTMVDVAIILMTMIVMTMMLRMSASAKAT